jgi:hypothetical protein
VFHWVQKQGSRHSLQAALQVHIKYASSVSFSQNCFCSTPLQSENPLEVKKISAASLMFIPNKFFRSIAKRLFFCERDRLARLDLPESGTYGCVLLGQYDAGL